MNKVLETIKNRRSIRKYKTEQIKQEELDLILEAGIYAPSGHNEQPWHFTVIQNKDLISQINTISKKIMANIEIDWIKKLALNPETNITYSAPTIIIVSGRKDGISAKTDCCAAVENMLIAAESLNIGSVWLGFAIFAFSNKDLAPNIDLPEGYEPLYAFALGYKDLEQQPQAPKRNYNCINYIR